MPKGSLQPIQCSIGQRAGVVMGSVPWKAAASWEGSGLAWGAVSGGTGRAGIAGWWEHWGVCMRRTNTGSYKQLIGPYSLLLLPKEPEDSSSSLLLTLVSCLWEPFYLYLSCPLQANFIWRQLGCGRVLGVEHLRAQLLGVASHQGVSHQAGW